MSNIWDSFAQGARIGGALHAGSQRRRLGEAYRTGGYDAVEDMAAQEGDFDTASQISEQAAQRQQRAHQVAAQRAQILGRVARVVQQQPYEQRKARIQQLKPQLLGYGFSDQQIDGFDPTDENLQNVLGLEGQFSQFVDIKVLDGNVVGFLPDGSTQIISQVPGQFEARPGMTHTTRVNPATGEVEQGGELPLRPHAPRAGAQAAPELPQGFEWE